MSSRDYPINLTILKDHWSSFMDGNGTFDLDVSDPLIMESWERCLDRFSPQDAPQIKKAQERHVQVNLNLQNDWLAIATPYLEDMYEQMGDSHQALLLTDRTGCLLFVQKNGTSQLFETYLGLEQGTYWQESQMGTNALGLTLITAMPTQVIGAEHFFQIHHHISSTAAPIYNEAGLLIGLVGMIGPADLATSRDLAFVTSTANAINSLLQTNQFLSDSNQQLTQVNAILETIPEGILMWDSLGRIKHCNAQVAKMFNVSLNTLSGKIVNQVIQFQPQLQLAIEQARPVHQIETVVQIQNRRLSCLATLKPIASTQDLSTGWIALLQPLNQVRELVQKQLGAQAFFNLDDFVSSSSAMKKVIRQAHTAAKGGAPILLQGEGGVGKKRLAQAIHNSGSRSKKPFISINCRAMPRELILHEILGIEDTQDASGRPSKFELADGGTLVIEAIEDMPIELQEVLLNFFDVRHITRIGGGRMIAVNVRVIVISTVDLSQRVREKSFSAQLYYQLSAFHLVIPSLRKRPDDINGVIERVLNIHNTKRETPFTIDPLAAEVLYHYPWPGNVRELENVLERAISHVAEDIIMLSDLPESIKHKRVLTADDPNPQRVLTLQDAEKQAILSAGWAHEGVVGKMAESLDIGRTTLWRKMKLLGISPEQFKSPTAD